MKWCFPFPTCCVIPYHLFAPIPSYISFDTSQDKMTGRKYFSRKYQIILIDFNISRGEKKKAFSQISRFSSFPSFEWRAQKRFFIASSRDAPWFVINLKIIIALILKKRRKRNKRCFEVQIYSRKLQNKRNLKQPFFWRGYLASGIVHNLCHNQQDDARNLHLKLCLLISISSVELGLVGFKSSSEKSSMLAYEYKLSKLSVVIFAARVDKHAPLCSIYWKKTLNYWSGNSYKTRSFVFQCETKEGNMNALIRKATELTQDMSIMWK